MPRERLERAFALATAVLVVLSVLTVAASGSKQPAGDLAFDPEVPDTDGFTAPTTDGTATVDGETYESLQAAVDAADRGETVRLDGRFDETVVVDTPNVTLAGSGAGTALLDGRGEGTVLAVEASGVTVRDLWVRNSGYSAADNDAAIYVNASGVTVRDSRVTAMTFGIWLNDASDARILDNTVVGREAVTPLTARGNGVQIWKSEDVVVRGNHITTVRDGIYYNWAKDVVAANNTMWDLRYGVHYMYSDDCVLRNNTAFDNDAGYALMVSKHLEIVGNVAVNNTGQSGHGILVKSIDATEIRGNHLVGNENGLFVYNSVSNEIADNLVVGNDVGVHISAGSTEETVYGNSFVRNDRAVLAVLSEQVYWNESQGNYWSGATPTDVDDDGVSDTRYQPAGAVQQLTARQPATRVFASSPAFDAVRLAQSSVPVVESPGVVDARPLTEPPHENWRTYYERD
ncbi:MULTISPECIES: nitrous oxide reductase family maturation protein NosD [Haloarcula]|uniref:Copper-binding periplasmic protein n=1 Tax=Haloarcula pellucida TaxID=1427151 RepID=A0A830GF21_9EURY|nr:MULTISPECIES: nitrous oxide reductase family maturation protein NosD [Halomicroarcula]MBX0346678.1 nitrous oxide reductase family maturation protein NosD [Halomicroarcula pellucida]MDS0277465.1 nitrous oxide reductase family maturation protein NosD [Halomicroarcula sp. S1AR25-4]GGN84966.1 copper-binding periplasmic protein [Halomicroarcula pellucida]